MLTYYLEPNTLTSTLGDYRAMVLQQESVEGDSFTRLAARTLNMSEGEVIGLLKGLAGTAQTLIEQGWGFSLPGFGRISFGIRGTFTGPDALYNSAEHSVSVNFRVDRALTAAAQDAPKERIHGVVHGPVIDAVTNMAAGVPNNAVTPGGNTKLTGKNIKIAGTDPAVGISFINGAGAITPVPADAVSHNGPTDLIFICPNLPAGSYHVQVCTQFTGGSRFMEHPRAFIFDTPLTVA